jgi:HK97 family phage major capsid protein
MPAMDVAEMLVQRFDTYNAEVKTALAGTKEAVSGVDARMHAIEQKMARAGSSGGDYFGDREYKSVGQQVADDESVELLRKNGGRGSARIKVESKALSSASGSAGSLVAPDRQTEIINLPRRTSRIRDLLAPGTTQSNLIHFNSEQTVTNNAAMVAEGAVKPESNIIYEAKETSVKTLAHWIKASNQIVDDAPQLMSVIDTTLRYMLDDVEDLQLLLGSGTGEDLNGLITAATPYVAPWASTGDTRVDAILKAIAQCEVGSQLPCTGIILHSLDWAGMMGIKTDDGDYLSAGPFSTTPPMLWGRPVVPTTACPQGEFVVLNGTQAAQIFDRMEAEVLISSEHSDLFVRNQVAIRAEKRLALVIKRASAIVHGTFPA